MFTLAMGFGNPTEIAIIAGVVILLFGGAKIANFGKSLGDGIRGFKVAVDEDPSVKPATSLAGPTAAPKPSNKDE